MTSKLALEAMEIINTFIMNIGKTTQLLDTVVFPLIIIADDSVYLIDLPATPVEPLTP